MVVTITAELSPRRETQNLQPSHMRVTAEADSQLGAGRYSLDLHERTVNVFISPA